MRGHRMLLLVAALAFACAREHEEARERTVPHAEVPGLETAVAVSEPMRDVVRAFGAVVAEREAPDVRDAQAQYAEAEARRTLADTQVRRLEALARGAVAPRRELEAARAEEASARAAAERARRVLAVFGAEPARPPLGAGETWVVAQIVQIDLAQVESQAAARFVPDAFPDRTLPGRVDARPSYVDPTTHTAPIPVRVQDPSDVLRPGMTGAVSIEVGPQHEAVVVPLAAVVYDERQPVVFVEESAGHFTSQPVRLGVSRGGRVEIASGLTAGARVATTGAASLLSAMRLPAGREEADQEERD